jgi:hypothetical protein
MVVSVTSALANDGDGFVRVSRMSQIVDESNRNAEFSISKIENVPSLRQ